jgi:hypothetical protein
MDRFTRYKHLRALWGRARTLLAWLSGPQEREGRVRAQRWQQIQVAERLTRDGIVRGTGDPDSAGGGQETRQREQQYQAEQARREAQRQWVEMQQRQAQQRRGR